MVNWPSTKFSSSKKFHLMKLSTCIIIGEQDTRECNDYPRPLRYTQL